MGLFFTAPQIANCQNVGFKYIKNYTDKDHLLQPQNWWILQDKRGIIYAANQGGLLEFDGVSWRSYKIPNNSVRSMAIDNKGTLYIGGYNEIGYFAPDEKGSLEYISLVNRLDENKRNFREIWKTHWTEEGIFFFTQEYLFRWNTNSKQLDVLQPRQKGHKFGMSYANNGKLFIRQDGIGLEQMTGDTLRLIPGGELFADKKIFMLAPYDSRNIILGTRSKGFFIYDGKAIHPFPTEADAFLKEKQPSRGIRLSSGDFAIGTKYGGLVIIDSRGKLIKIFGTATGLENDDVKYVFEDRQGNLWLALDQGISEIEYQSPVFICDSRSGLTGLVLSVIKHNDDLYTGTTKGLYSLVRENGTFAGVAFPATFRPLTGISGFCNSLLSSDGSLLAATSNGVFQVEKKIRLLNNNSYVLVRSGTDKSRLWVGTREGLFSLRSQRGGWVKEHKVDKINLPIHTIVEDINGVLWLGTLTMGIFKIEFPIPGTIDNPDVTLYDSAHGLPGEDMHVFKAAGHIMFTTQKGIFRFDEEKKSFIPDHTLGDEFAGGADGRAVFRIIEDRDNHIWFHSLHRNFQAVPLPDGNYVVFRKPFCQFPFDQANTIYPDPDGNNIWFACNEALIRFDKRKKKNYDLDFPTHIRRVVVNNKLIFDGSDKMETFARRPVPEIEYKNRKNLRFDFAAPFFEGAPYTYYQCLLEGHDDGWSQFDRSSSKDFTILDSGMYKFRVRSMNVYENSGSEDVFQFRILPPWYRTWWALISYAFIFFSVMFLVVKWRSGKLEREKEKLERVVKERTKEIEEKNLQLEKQTLQLKEQSEKLKEMDEVKSRFFANISHEFRTPLTLIMGPLEQMLSTGRYREEEKKLTLMLRNSQRLLGLINQLLELSKFESGKMKLQAVCQDIIPFLKGIVHSFDELATKNELDLTFQAEEEVITLYFDPEKLEEISFNLLSNAVKFTPAGGQISVAVKTIRSGEDKFPRGSLVISVSDTGPGIPRDQLAHIFDRFYQSHITYEHHRKGSGIGLAIAKELVELHHGSIDVHSSEDKGTGFVIQLPLGKEHLKPEEIAGISTSPDHYKSHSKIPAIYISEKEAATVGRGIPTQPGSSATEAGENPDNNLHEEGADSLTEEKNIILVVEDSTDVREYIREALEPSYRVIEAKDGREGIEKAQAAIPDLVISDIMMPEMDGCELCRRLKNDIRTSHIPIILLTAKASEESIIQGLETGADDYVTKPFNTRMLCTRIKNLIALRSHLQQTVNREMTLQPVEISVAEIDKRFIKKLQKIINENIADPEFNIEQLCRKMDMSQPTMYRKIHALTGESPTDFIRTCRLKRGAELLRNNFGSVLEVAFEVGFSSANYFTKCFKKMFHQLPSTFQATQSEN